MSGDEGEGGTQVHGRKRREDMLSPRQEATDHPRRSEPPLDQGKDVKTVLLVSVQIDKMFD